MKRKAAQNTLASPVTAVGSERGLQLNERLLRDLQHDRQDGGGKDGDKREIKDLLDVMRKEIARRRKERKREKEGCQPQQNGQGDFGKDEQVQGIGDGKERHIEDAVTDDQKPERGKSRQMIDGIGGKDSPIENVPSMAFGSDEVPAMTAMSAAGPL